MFKLSWPRDQNPRSQKLKWARLSLRDRVRSSTIHMGTGCIPAAPPHHKESTEVVRDSSWTHLFEGLPNRIRPYGKCRTHWRDYTVFPFWPRIALWSSKISLSVSIGRGMSGFPPLTYYTYDPIYMDFFIQVTVSYSWTYPKADVEEKK